MDEETDIVATTLLKNTKGALSFRPSVIPNA